MAKEKKIVFPSMPTRQWWALRNKFKQTIPDNVDANYVSTVLGMKEESAKTNIIVPLKAIKIIDQDGNTIKELAKQWRDDEHYPKLCEQIKKEIYPKGLLDAVPDPSTDRKGTERWFANATGAGSNAVTKMTKFYSLLCEADPSKAKDVLKEKKVIRKTTKAKISKTQEKIKEEPSVVDEISREKAQKPEIPSELPGLHINIQIHISSDSSTEQIDQIFASMAKHIYRRK